MNEKNLNVLIVGLGLIGGSFAAALKKKLPHWSLVGFDTDKMVAESCLEQGFLDAITTRHMLSKEIKKADLVILAIPILAIINSIESNKNNFKKGAVIMDVGSTKSKIIEEMDKLPENINAIGGHPMTGKKTSGVNGATPGLFNNKIFILTPSKNTNQQTLEFATELITTIGGVPLEIAPEQHDFLVAVVSHLPYLIPALLVNTANKANDDLVWKVAAVGFRSIAKNAGHNIPMWEDILHTNNQSIIKSLALFEEEIKRLKHLLLKNNIIELRNYLKTTAKSEMRLGE